MDGQSEFEEVMAEFRQWAKKTEEEGEQWRRAIEDCVSRMSRVTAHQGEEDLAGDVNGRTQVVEDEKYDADLERKQRILEDCEDNDIWMMQANTWIGICGICRVREGVWRGHDTLDCTMYTEGRELVRATHREIAKMFPAVGPRRGQLCLAPEGMCPGCKQMRRSCWMSVLPLEDLPDWMQMCRFSGVMIQSAAVILAMGPWFVEEWEARFSRGADYEERFGYLAVGRVWRAFGWLGAMDIRQVRAEELVEQYRRRLEMLAGKKEGYFADWSGCGRKG